MDHCLRNNRDCIPGSIRGSIRVIITIFHKCHPASDNLFCCGDCPRNEEERLPEMIFSLSKCQSTLLFLEVINCYPFLLREDSCFNFSHAF